MTRGGRLTSPALRGVALGVALLGACGCREDGLGYVQGRVLLDGKRLDAAMVEFQSDAGDSAYGRTDENGRYSLQATAGQAGLTPGGYTVRISTDWVISNPDGSRTRIPERVPARYHAQSELKRLVTTGTQTIDFELTGGD